MNVAAITKKDRPLSPAHFREFETCYGTDPNGRAKRSEADSPDGRWCRFTLDEIKQHHYKLDAFKWIRDAELDDPSELPEPEELITEAMEELKLALDDLARPLEAKCSVGTRVTLWRDPCDLRQDIKSLDVTDERRVAPAPAS